MTLDLDSSIMTRYGEQERTKAGYNPKKPGRASHHPLIAFMAGMRMVVNAWMRPGNTVSLSNYRAFLDETFGILADKKVGLVRADSGFFSNEYMKYFEERKMDYITVSLFRQIILKEIGQATLKTLRFKCVALGAWITEWSRQRTLKNRLGSKKKALAGWIVRYNALNYCSFFKA